MNQFTFRVTRPGDRLHKPFVSTWIHGETAEQAKEILSRTYQPSYGFKLKLESDYEGDKAKARLVKFSNQSLDSSSL